MIDEIFGMVKEYAGEVITKNTEIPQEKKALAIETTTESINGGLQQYLNPSNIAGLAGMFSGKNDAGSNGIASSLQNGLISALANKVGLNSQVASGIAATLLPMIISKISGKMNDPNDQSFDIGSLISSFSGNSQGGGGIMGSLGKLFK